MTTEATPTAAPPVPPGEQRVRVSGLRFTPTQLLREAAAVATAAPLFLVAPAVRRWHLRWGATDAEVAATMPGDALVRRCHFVATRAVTIDAPPSAVWPWLVQVGFGRAGFYSYDLLDNRAHPSARQIVPEWQELRVGAWVPMMPEVTEATAFRVAEFDPERMLLWTKPDSTWCWELSPTAAGGTRLVTRLRGRYDWSRPASAAISVTILELADFPMMRRMLLRIKARAETASASVAGPTADTAQNDDGRPERRPSGD